MKKRFIISTILLIITLGLIVSCSNEVSSGPGYGSITVYTGINSKSVQPSAEKIDFSYFIIHCDCSTQGINSIEKRFEGNTVNIENMIEGQWTLYVEGFNSSDELIGMSDYKIVTIVRDSTTSLDFILASIEGEGTLSLSIKVQTSRVSTIECSLRIGQSTCRTITMTSENRTLNEDGTYTFSKTINDVATGFYSSTVTMKDSEENVIGIALTPAIHIYANLESAYEFSWENLQSLLPSVDTPIPSIEPGRCFPNTEVAFSVIEEGATIWYSLNGSDFEKYTEPLQIIDNSVLRLYSEKQNLNQSEIVEYSYFCRVRTPEISLASGNYLTSELIGITISETDENATVFYTLDGSDPSNSITRTEYLPNISLSFDEDTYIRIVAIEDGFLNSEILDICYVAIAPTPVSSLQSGTFSENQELSFIIPERSRVYYTCDGTIPNENSTLYTGPISITNSCTIKAISIIDGVAPSSILTLDFNLNCLFSITESGEIQPIDKSSLPSVVIIPKRIDGILVTSIGDEAFLGCTRLTRVEISSSVTSIGEGAFYGCTGLTGIEIPNSVTSIGKSAFYNCTGLTSLIIPNSVKYLSGFDYCTGLTCVEIPNSVTSIGERAFYKCTALTNIEIPSSVASIGDHAFYGCTGLTSIKIPNSVKYLSGFDHCTGLTSIEIPNSVTDIGESALYGCTGLTSMDIPNSVISIGNDAFYNCTGLTSIVIPDSVTSIGDYAFSGCTGLTSIMIPKSATSIGSYVFSGWSNSQTIHITYGGFSANSTTWNNCSSVVIVTIPNTTTSIGNEAFSYCRGLASIEIPNSVTSIGYRAFCSCMGLTNIEIPSSVTSIGDGAFIHCTGLTSIEIPSSITSIGKSTFFYCTGLASLKIPNSVTSIGDYAFYNCTGLTSIKIPNSVKYLSGFDYCTGLTSIEIPNSVTDIGESAFYGCTGLTSMDIPNSVISIGNDAFYNCTGLTSIVIPDSVTSIGDYAFSGCTGLKSIVISNSIRNIGSYAFQDCIGLKYIVIPDSVTSIGIHAFSGCPATVVYKGSE